MQIMKTTFQRILPALMLVGLSLLGNCQKLKDSDIPAAVISSFKKTFSNADKVQWSKEGPGDFEAEFKSKGVEKSANFDASGKWVNTETVMKESDLPPQVKSAIAKEFAGYKVREVELYESPEKPAGYELELKKKNSEFEVIMAADGRILIKKEKKGSD
jgi:hypothetical protein